MGNYCHNLLIGSMQRIAGKGNAFCNARILHATIMKKLYLSGTLLIIILLTFLNLAWKTREPSVKVVVKKEGERYQLYRNNEPYFIKGAGGYKYYDRLKE